MTRIKVPYLQWREGRPRWEPGPGLRARGHKGRDLKDDAGRWLGYGAAIEAARALNQAANEGGSEAPKKATGRSFADLCAAYRAHAKFRDLAARTRGGYAQHMRILESAFGPDPAAAISRADISELYDALRESRGDAMANACVRTLKLLFYFALDELEWSLDRNRAARFDMVEIEGRLVVWSRAEIDAFVACADAMGLPAQADALLIGAHTALSQADVLALREADLVDGIWNVRRRKTGRACHPPCPAALAQRIAAMRARKRLRWPNVVFDHEVIARNGRPYTNPSAFAAEFRTVRALAAERVPSILDKRWQDLRDTAITALCDAGLSVPQIANISGHSLKTVESVIDKHYMVRGRALSATAAPLLDAHGRRG